ncbi:MAG: biotin--[acetyl-CoA-carboxylase] ligase [Actinobacteria bacterium]|nr:biotin--[acetyl-CoA-carboxylase] ligase [Actinomycetota bacterium]
MQHVKRGESGRRFPPWEIKEYATLDSTNLEARRLLDAGAREGLVVTARHQTGGRGRMGRGWFDLPGKSLMFSAVLSGVGGFAAAAMAALSVRSAVVELGGRGPDLKWPNDLVYGNRKVGGVLSESCTVGGKETVIVGLGLNVGYLPGELDMEARLTPTSLLVEEGRTWDLAELLNASLRGLRERLEAGGEAWMQEYRAHLAYLGERVTVNPPFAVEGRPGKSEEALSGIMRGVDGDGNLLLEVGGELLRVVSGDMAGG